MKICPLFQIDSIRYALLAESVNVNTPEGEFNKRYYHAEALITAMDAALTMGLTAGLAWSIEATAVLSASQAAGITVGASMLAWTLTIGILDHFLGNNVLTATPTPFHGIWFVFEWSRGMIPTGWEKSKREEAYESFQDDKVMEEKMYASGNISIFVG